MTEPRKRPPPQPWSIEIGGRLFRLAYGVLRDAAAAEDAVQQAALKSVQHRDRLRDSGAVEGWLARVVINESFLILRRREVERRALADRAHRPLAAEQAPDVRMERTDLVIHALEHLEEPTRTVVVLRIMHGVSGNDVAATLNLSASEISRRLHEGMRQLRAHLRAEPLPDGGLPT